MSEFLDLNGARVFLNKIREEFQDVVDMPRQSSGFQSGKVSGNTVSFYTTSDTTGTAAFTFDFPESNLSTADKTKLDGIAENAQVNVIETVKVNNTALAISNKSVNVDLSGYVATETDKGLSTNDYTNDEKNKLANIAANANNYSLPTASSSTKGGVKIGSGITISNETISISNATTSANGLMSSTDKSKLDGIAANANNYTLPDASSSTKGGVKIGSNISVSNGTISISKNNVTSALGYTPPTTNTTYNVATTSANGLMSSTDKSKLDGVATGAQVNVIETIKVNGTALTPSSKAVNIDISGKIDKVTGATAGHIASLNANGTIADSGHGVAADSEVTSFLSTVFS